MLPLFPDAMVRTVDDVPYEALYAIGYRAVLMDIDNTIVSHGFPADAHAIRLFERIRKAQLRPCLISNNQEARVRPFAEAVGARYLHKAGKPSAKGFHRALEITDSSTADTFFIGDQIFTDIAGARGAGLKTILVSPIDAHEEIQIVLKRYLERPVLALYKRRIKKHAFPQEDVFVRTVQGAADGQGEIRP